jgi:itaconate CoA-transferase
VTANALDDVLVVSLEQAVAGPYCSRLFAEAGARVIKLERPEGDFARAYDTVVQGKSANFVWLNSGKQSLAVDLTKAPDKALVERLLLKADVFIQNLRPGAVDRLGLSYTALQALNPGLVMCSISGYGLQGEYAQMKAYDALIQAETGLCSVTGPPGQPSKVGASVVDISTGLTAYAELLKALIGRGRNGQGRHVEVSMFGVMAEWMAVPLAYYEYADKLLGGSGLDHTQIAPYGSFACADGPLFIVIQNQREWGHFCREVLARDDMLDDPRFVTNAERTGNIDALRAEIEACLTTLPRAQARAKLLDAGIACGSINDVRDLGKHPALERKTVTLAGLPVSLPHRVGDILKDAEVPDVDQHGDAIRQEFS